MFGSKPLQINLNLDDGDNNSENINVEGFSNSTSDIQKFENFRNIENFDVRSLLTSYNTNSMSSTQNNNRQLQNNTNMNNLENTVKGMSFKGCPLIDKSKYVTRRQLARCYGCNPDSSLQ